MAIIKEKIKKRNPQSNIPYLDHSGTNVLSDTPACSPPILFRITRLLCRSPCSHSPASHQCSGPDSRLRAMSRPRQRASACYGTHRQPPTFPFYSVACTPPSLPSRRRCRSPRVLLPVHVWFRYQPRTFRPRRLSSSGGVSLHPQTRRKLVIVGDGTWMLPLLPCTRSSPVPIRRMRKDVLALLVRPRRVPQGICQCNYLPARPCCSQRSHSLLATK